MTDFIHVEEFDWHDYTGVYQIVTGTFSVEEVGEWIDGVWTVYHDVEPVSFEGDQYFLDGEFVTNTVFSKKQIEDWTDYVRNKLDEEYYS